MPYSSSTVALSVIPAGAAAPAHTPGSNWANGTYSQLIAATATDITLAGITFNNASNVNQDFEIDVAKGAAGAESVIATFRGVFDSLTGGFPLTIMLPKPISGIASGSRLAYRVRKNNTAATAWPVALMVYASNGTGMETTVKPYKAIPVPIAATAASGYVAITPSATANTNSAYNSFPLGTTAGTNLTMPVQGNVHSIAVNAPVGAISYEIDIATGAAGSEVVQTTVRSISGVAGGPHIMTFPPFQVQGGTRLAFRIRKTDTTTTTWHVALNYYEN